MRWKPSSPMASRPVLRMGEECTGLVDRRLFGARHWRYGRWCLDMALAADKGKAASFYIQELINCVEDGSHADGLTLEGARAGLAGDIALMDPVRRDGGTWVRQQRPRRNPSPAHVGRTVEVRWRRRTPQNRRAWQGEIEAQTAELRLGRGEPDLLHRAAEAYLGFHDTSSGKSPRQRLGDLVGSRADLVDLLISGMEGTITREDLPDSNDVVRLFDRQRVDPLVLPFVAGLHSLEEPGRLSDKGLD